MTPRSLLAPARLAGQPILRSQTDERLVDLVRAGHEPAFEAIVARYRRPLLRYCGRILSDERAEDAVQQTFVKAYNAMRRDESELNLRPWLYRIAHNTALNGLRDRGLRDEPLDPQIDGVERPDQAAERRQGVRDVLAAVEALPARQRDAIVLRELEGRSYEEIAGALGVTGGAVRQLLNRARTTLRAAATAITPVGLLMRVPFAPAADGVNGRVAELVGGAGGGAAAAKIGATMLVTGAVAGGVAGIPAIKDDHPRHDSTQVERVADDETTGSPSGDDRSGAVEPGDDGRGRGHRRGRGRGSDRGEHRRRRGRERGDDHGGTGERRHESGGDHHGGRSGGGDDGSHRGPSGGDRSGSGGGDGHSGSGTGDRSGPGGGGDDGLLMLPGDSSGPGPGSGSGGDGSGSGGDSSGPGSGSGGDGQTRTDSSSGSGSSGPG